MILHDDKGVFITGMFKRLLVPSTRNQAPFSPRVLDIKVRRLQATVKYLYEVKLALISFPFTLAKSDIFQAFMKPFQLFVRSIDKVPPTIRSGSCSR